MGDLKKKPIDIMIEKDNGKTFIVECMITKEEEQTVKRLQTYIQKFYEEQLEKQEQKEEEGNEDGQIQDIQKRDNRAPV